MSSVSSAIRCRLSAGTILQRAHIVQAVGQFDEEHPHVVGDGEEQLAEIFRLFGAFGDEIEPSQLGQALDQLADFAPEGPIDVLARRFGVLDRVVQHGRDDRRIVEPHLGEDRGDLQRMRE